jgi:hypothetical protein
MTNAACGLTPSDLNGGNWRKADRCVNKALTRRHYRGAAYGFRLLAKLPFGMLASPRIFGY